jgi:hypothetical protein
MGTKCTTLSLIPTGTGKLGSQLLLRTDGLERALLTGAVSYHELPHPSSPHPDAALYVTGHEEHLAQQLPLHQAEHAPREVCRWEAEAPEAPSCTAAL